MKQIGETKFLNPSSSIRGLGELTYHSQVTLSYLWILLCVYKYSCGHSFSCIVIWNNSSNHYLGMYVILWRLSTCFHLASRPQRDPFLLIPPVAFSCVRSGFPQPILDLRGTDGDYNVPMKDSMGVSKALGGQLESMG